jgi:hypothetical protein
MAWHTATSLFTVISMIMVWWTQDPTIQPPDRKLLIDCQNHQMVAKGSVAKGSAIDDAFSMTMQARSGSAKAEFEYYSKANDRQTSLDFSFTITKLVEYIETPGSPMYDPKKVPKAQRVKVWRPHGWAPFTYEVVKDVHHVEVSTMDGVLKLKAHFTTTPRVYKGLQLDPNSVKMDVEVHDFPYSRNDTRLCLVAEIQSLSTQRVRSTSFNGMDFENSGAPFGKFQWVPEAKSGSDTKINVALKVSEGGRVSKEGKYHGEFYYSMITNAKELHPVDMIWDPVLGLDYSKRPPKTWGHYCVTGALAVVLVGLLLHGGHNAAQRLQHHSATSPSETPSETKLLV